MTNNNAQSIEEVPAEPQESANVYKDFQKDFLHLTFDEPFLASISMRILKVIDTTMPTAYVGVRDMSVNSGETSYRLIMGLNPTFMEKWSSRQRQGVLMHELYHVAMKHITERLPYDKQNLRINNIAADLAINSLITSEKLPDICLIPGKIPLSAHEGKPIQDEIGQLIKSLPRMQSTEFYFQKLKEFAEEQAKKDPKGDPFAGVGPMDSHDKWGDIPAEVQEEFDNYIRSILEDSVKEADRSNNWGSIPSEMRDQIRKSLVKEVDWKSIVRAFIGRVRSQDRESTIKRLNKKLPYIFPGVKRTFVSRFACFIDQSGSVSDEDVSLLFSELQNLAKHVEMDVFNFDTEVDLDSHFQWKKNALFSEWARTRCGGTDFNCVTQYCNDPKTPHWDGIIMLTDGYAPVMTAIRGSKVLWVITPGGTKDAIRSGDLVVQMKNDDAQKKFERK